MRSGKREKRENKRGELEESVILYLKQKKNMNAEGTGKNEDKKINLDFKKSLLNG